MPAFFLRLLSTSWKIFLFLLATDFLLLCLNLAIAQSGNFFFHLDQEQNLPTIYQSFKLIIFGGFFLYRLLELTASLSLDKVVTTSLEIGYHSSLWIL